MLRSNQTDYRHVVRYGLETLFPILPLRLAQTQAQMQAQATSISEARTPIWIRYTRKVLVEEGHMIANFLHLFHLIVRHEDAFYPARAQFVPHLINSLHKLGLSTNGTPELRQLALDLVETVIVWEKRRQERRKSMEEGQGETTGEEKGDGKRGPISGESESSLKRQKVEESGTGGEMDESGGDESREEGLSLDVSPQGRSNLLSKLNFLWKFSYFLPIPADDDDYIPSWPMQEVLFTFLLRMMNFAEHKDTETRGAYKRSSELVKELFEAFPDSNFKMNCFEKNLHAERPKLVLQNTQKLPKMFLCLPFLKFFLSSAIHQHS